MKVRITHIDGKMPNLACMKLLAWHKAQGDDVHFTQGVQKDLFERGDYDRVYGSAVFKFTTEALELFRSQFPDAIVGGTGTDQTQTIEQTLGIDEFEKYDYEPYPEFEGSLGFTQRGCRLKCKFCVVPQKEGKPRSVNSIHDIWRGGPHPKNIHLLDNDFFGQPEDNWRQRLDEAKSGGFKICFSQGINIRLISEEVAQALTTIEYRDNAFERRRLYTAWDNLKDENIFFRGVDRLEAAGIPPKHLMAFMLIGYAPNETLEQIMHRHERMVARGILPYPMVYDNKRKDLKAYQRWVIRRFYEFIPFEEFKQGVAA